MPSKLSRFWQELKRRNVTRVLAVYIAAAFMLLELLDMISDPFGLPAWSVKVGFFVLLAGLFIAIIVSWIYDIHPEGGMVKTKPVDKIKEDEIQKSFNSWRTASYISFGVILILIVLNIIPRTKVNGKLEKSIAVLPFHNESSDRENTYFINGTMESILDNLCKIEDLRVVSRNSTEQYRHNPKTTPQVAEEMNVSYILEGSGQKIGNRVLLTVQLIEGIQDRHLWSKQYDREIQKVVDLIDLQGEIAKLIAAEINVVITPQEKVIIENIPTESLTAYDYYQQGNEEYWKYINDRFDLKYLEQAKSLYNKALVYDSTFAIAYIGLAVIYQAQQPYEDYATQNYLDSVLIYSNRALEFNDQLAVAYRLKAHYYIQRFQLDEAIHELNIALDINPNDYLAYAELGRLYSAFLNDPVKSLQNYHNALLLYHGEDLSRLLESLADVYVFMGFPEKAREIYQKVFELNGDSVMYYFHQSRLTDNNDFSASRDLLFKGYELDSNNYFILWELAQAQFLMGEYESSLYFYERLSEIFEMMGGSPTLVLQNIGYLNWVEGKEVEATHYFNEAINFNQGLLDLGREHEINHYILASIYAVRGERDLAYEQLGKLRDRAIHDFWVIGLNTDPMFESMRSEPEFHKIILDIESKYQIEHERVKQWLEENDML
jgi:TolB-like protein